ncbi:nucleotide exchange factor GrpE [Rubrobacter taiwanensis]|uniref:Protein GrpE n=1 Tax=Rubrobacter taiwanensis TaxID=185139 RepID=A0A4R1BDR9_9ACTN|nr:nucleotide exchange factor GrpE [Rubrobacter taiwanensis]
MGPLAEGQPLRQRAEQEGDRVLREEEHNRREEELQEPGEPAAEEPQEQAGAQEELTALREELEAVRRERDSYLEHMQRLKAELDNSRKRMERERSRIVQLASENLIRELLPVLDNLERALESKGDIHEGVRAIRDQLLEILRNEGLTPVASDGQHFDPSVHEAVMGQPSEEHEEDTVLQTVQKGYLLHGKPVRPAKVIVAKQV